MAQYKVLQDIEADDKLLGPLSLRQFIYAAIVVVQLFIAFQLASRVSIFFVVPFLPTIIFFGLLAAPIGQNQSSEIWLLAKIRYFVFPRRRIWNQDGILELVTITVPKKIEEHLSKEFSQEEVKSRLKALASTLDTRGWAVKNVGTETFQRAAAAVQTSDDRLVTIAAIPQEVPFAETPEATVLDPGNPLAQKMEAMIKESGQEHRQEIIERMRSASNAQTAQPPAVAPAPVASPNLPTIPINPAPAVIAPQPLKQEVKPMLAQPILANSGEPIHPSQQPAISADLTAQETINKKPQAAMTTRGDAGILEDVKDKGRTSIDVSHDDNDSSDDDKEVVISLH